ncbi:hypothetical protein JCM8202v2_000844 [Rhodotorula sphaerocarpa]
MGTVSLPLLHWSEGFTIDVVIRVVNRLVFNAQQIRTVLLVYAVTRATQASKPGLSFWQACVGGFKLLPTLARSDLFFQATLGLLAFTLVLKGNKLLDRAARNNFTRDLKGWHWSASDNRREIVLITGGAGGLGSNVARRLAGRGIQVVVLDRAPLEADAPKSIAYFKVDLTDADAVRAVAEKVRSEVGHPTVLVNMAAVVQASSIVDMAKRDIDLAYDINVKAQYYTVQAFLPHMLEDGHGHVVAAVLSFHEGLTEELRHLYQPHAKARAVRTSVVCPAHFKSGMFAGFVSTIPHWLAPSLEVDTVAHLVEETILSGESQHIIEPYYASFTPLGRALPTWIYGGILACAKDAMGHVQTHRGKAE